MRIPLAITLLLAAGLGASMSAVGGTTDRSAGIDPLSEGASPPVFPADALSQHIGGTVILMVKIGTDGVAKDIKVFDSSGFRSLDLAAIKAAYNWRYIPAIKDKRPIEAYAKIPVSFEGKQVKRVVDHSARKRFVTQNDPVFGDYAKAAEARILAKGNELYPDDARKNHWYGSVITATCIRRDGSVDSVEVVKSSGIVELDRSIVDSTKAAAPFDSLKIAPDGPDQLCVTATYAYAPAKG